MPVYREIWDGPARNYRRSSGRPVTSRKKYVTVHNTSNDASAADEASYAKRRTDGTSSHYYVDNNSIFQSLNTDWCAGHVGSHEGNTYGISYEITGVNGWTRARWIASVAWDLLAAQMAIDCHEFGIEVRQLSIAEMRAGTKTGFITHDQARRVWGSTTHTDPGPGFPMDHLLALVRRHMGGKPTVEIGDEETMFAQIEDQTPVYRIDAFGREHLTGPGAPQAWAAAQKAGHKAVIVANMEQLDALTPTARATPVALSEADRELIVASVSERILAGLDVTTIVRAELDATRLARLAQ